MTQSKLDGATSLGQVVHLLTRAVGDRLKFVRKKIISQLRDFCPKLKTVSSENVRSSLASRTKYVFFLFRNYI